ncbi:MAG: NUDIX domain-containing protein [Acidimicrobiales bacterium]
MDATRRLGQDPPVAAATVVPLRDAPEGIEVLMLRKNSKLAFGGMWVFPGGRVDAADLEEADLDASDQPGADEAGAEDAELRAARRAAVREAVEEAGVVLDSASLVPFSHWTPPPEAPRRFATWFFLAPLRDAVDIVIDGGEIHDHTWIGPADALARRDAGEVELAPPTWVTLSRLAPAADVDAALAEARASAVERFETRIATIGQVLVAVWEGDAGFEDGDVLRPGGRRRLVMDPAGWRGEVDRPA